VKAHQMQALRPGVLILAISLSAGCAVTSPAQTQLEAGTAVTVLLPSVAARPTYLVVGDPTNYIPLVNMAVGEAEQHALRDSLTKQGLDLGTACQESIRSALDGAGIVTSTATANHRKVAGVPRLVSTKDLPAALPASLALDTVVYKWGFSGSVATRVQVTMSVRFRLLEVGNDRARYEHTIHYRPGFLGSNSSERRLEPDPVVPTWKDGNDLQSHMSDAVAALGTVCSLVTDAAIAEML
jgi:hypothetical protein